GGQQESQAVVRGFEHGRLLEEGRGVSDGWSGFGRQGEEAAAGRHAVDRDEQVEGGAIGAPALQAQVEGPGGGGGVRAGDGVGGSVAGRQGQALEPDEGKPAHYGGGHGGVD